MTEKLTPTEADQKIAECIENETSFSVIAGAGSGKTTSLVEALKKIRETRGKALRKNGQRVLCITYTNRAVDVISSRLGFDELYCVSTLHRFLWGEVVRFQDAIREALCESIIPQHIQKARDNDNGGNSQKAQRARKKIEKLNLELEALKGKPPVSYEETIVSDYSKCVLNHDDVIDVAAYLISNKPVLRKGLGFKYPYIFVDEAQDTFPQVVSALNAICAQKGLPLIGYFGDPMQQIYDKRAGNFEGPEGSVQIPKKENFRCSTSVIDLLNNFRTDLRQEPGGKNAEVKGSVLITVVQAPAPEGERNRYTAEQLDDVTKKFGEAVDQWNWLDDIMSVKHLFLARQMIARRLGFTSMHKLFTGPYSSSKSQSNYEDGTHYLLKPFVNGVLQLVEASRTNDEKTIIETLRRISPAFDHGGKNKSKSLKDMLEQASKYSGELAEMWSSHSAKEILEYCSVNALFPISERLAYQLNREIREEFDANSEDHQREKGDWLADEFFKLGTDELEKYIYFLDENSPFSTQHGVKGEQYKNVLVMIDDIEAAWNTYSFSKVLTPSVAGEPLKRQKELTEKLAYVCFSRAEVNLRILLFSSDAKAAGKELINRKLFSEDQVEYL